MYNNFLIMYDSDVSEQEERMIEVSLDEAVNLFPNLNILLMQPNDGENFVMADEAIKKARISADGAVNAADVLKTISIGATGGYAMLFLTKKLYALPKDLGLGQEVPSEITDVSSENAFVYDIGGLRDVLELDDRMYMMNHMVSNAIAHIVFDLKPECKDPDCMMFKGTKSSLDVLELARRENHDGQRLCEKCREKALKKIPYYERKQSLITVI